jgi:hypothetical protein
MMLSVTAGLLFMVWMVALALFTWRARRTAISA